MDIVSALNRHERIALQFSGGKDSLACLHLMSGHLDRVTIYWLDTGDSFPETIELIEQVERFAPRVVRIAGNQPQVVAEHGIPTDLVPVDATRIGLMSGGKGPLMQDRFACCWRARMAPMQQRMIDDGITLIIRGQKASDKLRAPIQSGHVENGIEYLFPIEGWDDARVMDYLRKHDVHIPRFYETMVDAPDCMTCSAYWGEGRGAYLKKHHPQAHTEYQRRLNAIADATAASIAHFNTEIG